MSFKSGLKEQFFAAAKKQMNWTEADDAFVRQMSAEAKPVLDVINFFSSVGILFAAGMMSCIGMIAVGMAVIFKSIVFIVIGILLIAFSCHTFFSQTMKRKEEWDLICEKISKPIEGETNEGA